MRARMKIRVVILVVRVIGKIGQRNICFLRTTVLKENKQYFEVQYKDNDRIKYLSVKL